MTENTAVVNTEQGDVIVSRLALKGYADIIRALKPFSGDIADLIQGKDSEELKKFNDLKEVMLVLPDLIADNVDEFAAILAIATDKDAGFILSCDLAETVDIAAKVLELNNYQKLVQTIKKVAAGWNPASPKPQD